MHALRAERLDGERGDERRVDPAGDADHDLAEAVLLDVVAQPELEREPHLLQRRRASARSAGDARARRRARGDADVHDRRPAVRSPRSCSSARRRTSRRRRAITASGSTSTTSSASSNPGARASTSPSSSSTTEWPSKTSSSWPPTALHERDEARVVARAGGEHLLALALLARGGTATPRCSAISCAPASARSVAGGPGCQMSSQTVDADQRLAVLEQEEVAPRREVARPRRRRRSSAGTACGRRPSPRRRAQTAQALKRSRSKCGVADEHGDPARLARDLLERLLGRPDEPGSEQQILRADSPVTASSGKRRRSTPASFASARRSGHLLAVAVEVADDGVDLGEPEPQMVFASQSKT